MSEWLDLMLEEVKRKQREAMEAEEEQSRREHGGDQSQDPEDQSK